MQPLSNEPSLRRRAFTLVEVLMVLAIMGIMTLVTMPYLVKSIRGNRLRVSTSTIVQAGRYARSMALLGQRDMRLVFDLNLPGIRVEPRYETPPAAAPDNGSAAAPDPSIVTGTNEPSVKFSPGLNVSRPLDAVRIDYVEIEHRERQTTGTVSIIYRSNGRCTPYVVRLVDEFGSATLTRVDALSTPNSEQDDR
jgi:prepilin-type N-terminal cleavage/methylation domain-containing protein